MSSFPDNLHFLCICIFHSWHALKLEFMRFFFVGFSLIESWKLTKNMRCLPTHPEKFNIPIDWTTERVVLWRFSIIYAKIVTTHAIWEFMKTFCAHSSLWVCSGKRGKCIFSAFQIWRNNSMQFKLTFGPDGPSMPAGPGGPTSPCGPAGPATPGSPGGPDRKKKQ